MTTQTAEQVNYKEKALSELKKIREYCHRWPVADEIRTMREYLKAGGLSLADIGTSEEEIQSCFREGHRNSARNWLKVARENDSYQNVLTAVHHIRNRIAEAGLTLDDIGTSEAELEFLLASRRPKKGLWQRLFGKRGLHN
ncbi:MAG: hypothetical protein N2506_01920 [Dehalococcoidales bacterium]|nr:hypothetical protein [Dehalococcoidales bacterium]